MEILDLPSPQIKDGKMARFCPSRRFILDFGGGGGGGEGLLFHFILSKIVACIQTPPFLKRKWEREISFLKRGAAVHRLGSTGHGFSLLSVTVNNILWQMQGCIKNLSNFNLFTGNFRFNCTSHPNNRTWATSEFSCDRKSPTMS